MSTLNISNVTEKYKNLNISDEKNEFVLNKELNKLETNNYIKIYYGNNQETKHQDDTYNDVLWLTGC